METPLPKTILQVIVGGGIVFLLGIYLGNYRVNKKINQKKWQL